MSASDCKDSNMSVAHQSLLYQRELIAYCSLKIHQNQLLILRYPICLLF